MDHSLNNLFAVSMALNDLTLPKTIGSLNAIETQRLRHRLLALGNRYTDDKENNIFIHVASESRRLHQEKNKISLDNEAFDKQVAQLHAKLGAGLNVVAQSHGNYTPNIQIDSLINADKTQQITRSAFNVLKHDPRPLIQHWGNRIIGDSPLNYNSLFESSEAQINELKKRINRYSSTTHFSKMGEGILFKMQNLQNTPLSSFDKNSEIWSIPQTDFSGAVSDNVAATSAIAGETAWSDIVDNVITGVDFVNESLAEITADTMVDSIMDFLVDFAIDCALDACTFGLWTIGKFIVNIFFGGLGLF